MQELTIKDIFGIIKKRLVWIILVPLLVGLVVGVYYYSFADNIYTATTSLYVLIRYEDATGTMRYDTTTSNYFTSDYNALFERSPVIKKTEEAIGLSPLSDSVEIDVVSVSNTRIVEVSATGKDPYLCMQVANTASRIFKEYIEEFMKVDSVSITQEAEMPEQPSGPPRMRNTALAVIIALVATVGIVLALEMMNTRITTDKQAEELLGQPVLGKVSDYRKELANYFERERNTVNNFYKYIPAYIRENVKAIALNIGFASVDNEIKTIAVTSTQPREGKSSMTMLLASAFAEEGKYVLIVDMDFRNPTLGRLLKTRNPKDLMDYLSGRSSMEEIVSASPVPNVAYIDSSHSSALLTRAIQSERFDRFLMSARKNYDIVIFDTPPVGFFVDAAVIGPKTDGVVMVLASNQVEAGNAQEAVEQLQKSGSRILGVILNMNRASKQKDYRYYGDNRRRESVTSRATRSATELKQRRMEATGQQEAINPQVARRIQENR